MARDIVPSPGSSFENNGSSPKIAHVSLPSELPNRITHGGGGNDAMARIVSDKMSKTLGQQIVIRSRGGAGGKECDNQPDALIAGATCGNLHARNPSISNIWRWQSS
jgi:hypothetical protein